MAILQGISGMQMGDGAGGKVALSLETRVLRILADTEFSYLTATLRDPSEVKSGTVTYYVPELIGTKNYGTGTNAYGAPNSGIVSVNLDKRKDARMIYETFDVERLLESDYIIGMISTGIAMSIQATLNAAFLIFLKSQFETGAPLASQVQVLDFIGKKDAAMTPENSRQDYTTLQYLVADLSQMFDKLMIGVNKAELHTILSLKSDIGLRNAFWNQPNALGTFPISPTLAGKELGNIRYTTDKMLDKLIPAGTSFSEDEAVDLTNYIGFVLHNESVAMPLNLNKVINMIDPQTGNPLFLAKFQYGIGILRPKLVWALKNPVTRAK